MVVHSDGKVSAWCTAQSSPHLVQVIDELREVLDRVDVVVRRRRDERHAGLGAAQVGDVGRDLGAGELAALAGLGALRDLWVAKQNSGGPLLPQ
jgi:molybdopterin-guanine dinucleotide biosynthesis protein A